MFIATSAYQMVSLLMEAKPGGTTLTGEKAFHCCTSKLNSRKQFVQRLQLDRGIALAPVGAERNNCPVSVRTGANPIVFDGNKT